MSNIRCVSVGLHLLLKTTHASTPSLMVIDVMWFHMSECSGWNLSLLVFWGLSIESDRWHFPSVSKMVQVSQEGLTFNNWASGVYLFKVKPYNYTWLCAMLVWMYFFYTFKKYKSTVNNSQTTGKTTSTLFSKWEFRGVTLQECPSDRRDCLSA